MFRRTSNRPPGGRQRGRFRAAQRGIVLLWATLTVLFIAGVIIAATDDLKAVDQVTKAEFSSKGVALEVAHAGVVDAYAWLRRQSTQPVEVFAPQLDLESATRINETDDPDRGLVRTFEISPGLWGRYEVLKGVPSEGYTDENGNGFFDVGEAFDDTNNDGKWTPGRHTRDVTVERGLPGNGTVWLLEADAIVFRRPRADLPLGEGPNQRVARASLATEVRRLTIKPPATAAVCVLSGNSATFGTRAKIRSDAGTAVAYRESTGVADVTGAEIEGGTTAVPDYKSDIDDIFGVSWTELKSMADISTTDSEAGVPAKLPDFGLVVITGDVVFDAERPLRGTGVVVVEGNCTIASGSNSFFNGLLYVSGDLTARAPAYLRGTIIANDTVDVRGTGGDYCEIEYDDSMVSRLLTRMGQYRYSKAPYVPLPLLADGRPHELGLAKRRFGEGYADAMGTGAGGSAGGGESGGSEEPPPPEPTPGFATDGLIDAIEEFLALNPGVAGADLLLESVEMLDLARQSMAQDPQDTRGALNAVRDAMDKLTQAIEEDIPTTSFYAELDGGDGTATLYPQMRNTVESMLGDTGAPAEVVVQATDQFNEGVSMVDRARDRMATGNESGSLADYRAAAAHYRDAIGLIDVY